MANLQEVSATELAEVEGGLFFLGVVLFVGAVALMSQVKSCAP